MYISELELLGNDKVNAIIKIACLKLIIKSTSTDVVDSYMYKLVYVSKYKRAHALKPN